MDHNFRLDFQNAWCQLSLDDPVRKIPPNILMANSNVVEGHQHSLTKETDDVEDIFNDLVVKHVPERCKEQSSFAAALVKFIIMMQREKAKREVAALQARARWMSMKALQEKFHPMLRDDHGPSWTIPCLSADGLLYHPLPAESHGQPGNDKVSCKAETAKPGEKTKRKRGKATVKAQAQAKHEPLDVQEPCAEPEPPEAQAQLDLPQSSREPLDEPGIEADYIHQCDCDGYGNELPDGSYIISVDACHHCPWCVWKESMTSKYR